MRFVVAVAEERNFTRAAMRCHISQPALSRRVSEVESVVGARLFERRTRSVSITKAGHLFVREARRTLEQGQRTVSLVQTFAKQEECPVSLGLSALADQPRLFTLIESAKGKQSSPRLSIETAATPELLLALLRGDLDLAIVDLPARVRRIRLSPLMAEPLVAALPERLASTKRPATELSELLKLPLVLLTEQVDPARTILANHISSAGVRGFRIHDAASVPELLDQVAVRSYIGLIRQSAMRFQRQGVVYKPLAEPIQVGCALAWRDEDRRPAMLALRDSILFHAQRTSE
jgi:DNA-binding transcriptional LysR family regulator